MKRHAGSVDISTLSESCPLFMKVAFDVRRSIIIVGRFPSVCFPAFAPLTDCIGTGDGFPSLGGVFRGNERRAENAAIVVCVEIVCDLCPVGEDE